MRDIADSGASLTGATIAPNEAQIGNERFFREGIYNCQIVECDCNHMPFEEGIYDSAYAVRR